MPSAKLRGQGNAVIAEGCKAGRCGGEGITAIVWKEGKGQQADQAAVHGRVRRRRSTHIEDFQALPAQIQRRKSNVTRIGQVPAEGEGGPAKFPVRLILREGIGSQGAAGEVTVRLVYADDNDIPGVR